ncbi:MAG: Uma2 family endonuclease [Alphaproteobacteria bacterium]|nr:Uma2 family endonuclease [Alphaproteobacteria bacterium]
MSATSTDWVTEEVFLRRPDALQRSELLDGQVLVSPSSTFLHQTVSWRLAGVLRDWCETHPPHVARYAPLDVRFAPGRILQPDLVVFGQPLPLDQPLPIDVVPALCVEILSEDARYDRHTKRLVYGAAGVPEYWVIDPHGAVEVFSGAGLTTRTVAPAELVSVTLPDLVVDVIALRT